MDTNQRGFVNIVLVVIVLVGVGAYFILNWQTIPPIATPAPSFTLTPSKPPNPTPIAVASSKSGWDPNKIYFYYNENKHKDNLIFLRFYTDGKPIFRSSYENNELILGDEFYVKLKDGFTLDDLQNLNQKYDVNLVNEQYGFYTITVKNNPYTNALEMANTYHDEPITQWAMPLWRRQHELR